MVADPNWPITRFGVDLTRTIPLSVVDIAENRVTSVSYHHMPDTGGSGGGTIIYETLGAFEEATIEPDVDAAFVFGYAAPGDGGHAIYRRIAIEPLHEGKAETADGSWWELAETELHVGMFGAFPGGDPAVNTAAIQAAINTSHTRGGQKINFGTGTYLLGPPATGNYCINLDNKHNVWLRGVGRDLTTLAMDDSCIVPDPLAPGEFIGKGVLRLYLCNRPHVSDLTINGMAWVDPTIQTPVRRFKTGVHGINLDNCPGAIIEWLRITNTRSYGIGGGSLGINKGVKFSNLLLEYLGDDAIDLKNDADINDDTLFENITIKQWDMKKDSGKAGIDVRGPALLSNIYIEQPYPTGGDVGVRFRLGQTGGGNGLGGHRSSLVNFRVRGDGTLHSFRGVHVLASDIHIANGVCVDCGAAVRINSKRVNIMGVTSVNAVREGFSTAPENEDLKVIGATVAVAGSNYTTGDIVQVSGGTGPIPCELAVVAAAGAITSFTGPPFVENGEYSVAPTSPAPLINLSVANPLAAGGQVNLTIGAISTFEVDRATPQNGGTGFAVGDLVQVQGGTSLTGTKAELIVTKVTGGAINAFSVGNQSGEYNVAPTSPAALLILPGLGATTATANLEISRIKLPDNLTLTGCSSIGSRTDGIWLEDADYTIIDNCRFMDNVDVGVRAVVGMSGVQIRNSYFNGNGTNPVANGIGVELNESGNVGYAKDLVQFSDDFIGDSVDARWTVPTLVGGASATISASNNGLLALLTGTGVGTDGSQIASALQWRASNSELQIEFRLALSAITDVMVYAGFSDTFALEAAFTLSGTTLTSTATNAVGVLFDTAATIDTWRLVGVAADVDATMQDTGVAPVAGTFEKWRIVLSSAGIATFYRNGVIIGTTMTGAVTAAASLTPFVTVWPRIATVRTANVDYIKMSMLRV